MKVQNLPPKRDNLTIDSHQHFWKYDSGKHFWIKEEMKLIRKDFLPEDLLPVLKRNHIDGCVAVQVEHNEQETEFLLHCAAEYDFIKGVVGWVDLSSEDLAEHLERFSMDGKFKGIRHTEYDKKGEFLLDPSFRKGIRKLQEFEFTFDLLVLPHQLQPAIALVREFPNQPFVLDHLGKPAITAGPSREWAAQMKELGACKNVFAKLSGMVTETSNLKWKPGDFDPFLDVMLYSFGTSRLMFGSDWPVCTAAAGYEEVTCILKTYFEAFSKNEQDAIFGTNAARFYRLP